MTLRGSRRGERRARTEVVGTDGEPIMLECITTGSIENKKIYDECVAQIKKLGVMKEQDGIAVSMLAHEIALGEHAAAMAAQTGGDVIDGKRGPMQNPWARARRDARDAAWRILTHFGLTASSRVNLQGQKDTGDRKAKDIASLFKFGS